VLLVLLMTATGAAVDQAIGSGLGVGFAVGYVVGALLGVLLVHRRDLLASVVAPPLVYVIVVLVSSSLTSGSGSGSVVVRYGLELVNELILGAPVLLGATAGTLVLAVVRWRGTRRAR